MHTKRPKRTAVRTTVQISSEPTVVIFSITHEEAAKRMSARTDEVTTKEAARSLLRKLGILNKKHKLVKALS